MWGWRVGRVPAVRAAREAAGGARPPGGYPRVSSSGRVPSCLTSSRRCGKMLHEGSHRRRSQRRPSSTVRQKPGRFRNDRALLYPVTPRTRPIAASNAPNATKPLFILLRSPDPNKSPHAAGRERQQKIGFVAFRARGVVAALLKNGTLCPPSVQDGTIVPRRRYVRQPNIMRQRVRPRATRLFFCPHRVFCLKLRRSHRVNHRH